MNIKIIFFVTIFGTLSLKCAESSSKRIAIETTQAALSNTANKEKEEATIESITQQIANLRVNIEAKPVTPKKNALNKPQQSAAAAAQPLALPVTPAPMPEPPTLDDAHGSDCDCIHCIEPITPKFAPISGETLNGDQVKQK